MHKRTGLLLCLMLAGSALALLFSPARAQADADVRAQAVVRVVEDLLRQQAAELGGALTLAVDPPRIEHLPACDQLSAALPSGSRLRSRLTVTVRCAAPQAWTAYVQASIGIHGTYYVAARTIQAGQALQAEQIAAAQGDLLSLPAGTVTDPARIPGMTATHRITVGQPLRLNALRNAQSVLRGHKVRIMAHGNGFTVSSEGQATEDGAPGSTVQVRTASGQLVSGVVRDAATVEVLY